MHLSYSFRIEYAVRLFSTFFKLSTIIDNLSLNLACHFQQSLLHALFKSGFNKLISFSHFAEPFKFSFFELALHVPAVPAAYSLNIFLVSSSLNAVSVFIKKFAFSLYLPILPATLVNIAAVECVFSEAVLLVKEKFSLVQIAGSIFNASFSFNDSFLHFSNKRIIIS